MSTHFGQLVIGPPGSGKTTFCRAMSQFLKAIGRDSVIVNLDPDNVIDSEESYYEVININELIDLQEVMNELDLGPNGSMIYTFEFLHDNIDWLLQKLKGYKNYYFIFDLPGQVELYVNQPATKKIFETLQKNSEIELRLTIINLIESTLLADSSKFLSAVLMTLSSMIHLECSQLNVITKLDLLKTMDLEFSLDFYTDLNEMQALPDSILSRAFGTKDSALSKKYHRLTEILCETIEDYSLVKYLTVDINDKESMYFLLKYVDKSNGYIYAHLDKPIGSVDAPNSILNTVNASNYDIMYMDYLSDLKEKYLPSEQKPTVFPDDHEQYDEEDDGAHDGGENEK